MQRLLSAAIAVALTTTLIPVQITPAAAARNCCAMMQMQSAPSGDACDHDLPKQSNDDRCCAACAVCVALLSEVSPFVYAASGERAFAGFLVDEHSRFERPPVPPPRVGSV